MQTIQDLITRRKLAMTVKDAKANPNMANSANMNHWTCRISNDAAYSMYVVFSLGSAHGSRVPEISEVLNCLASEAAGVENARSFEEWCGEYGYDTDSRHAERIYKTCQEQADDLKSLMGADYQGLLFDTERL